MNDTDGVVWQLALCLILAWIVVYLCLVKGIHSVGKVSSNLYRWHSMAANPMSYPFRWKGIKYIYGVVWQLALCFILAWIVCICVR